MRLVVSVFCTDPRMCLFCSELAHSLINYDTRILVSKWLKSSLQLKFILSCNSYPEILELNGTNMKD